MTRRLTAILVTAWCLTLAGCGDSAGDRGADFVYAVRDEHVFFDPQKISWVSDGRVAHCLFEPLISYHVPDLALEPAAAQSWTVSDDGLTYTFGLRPGARWSSGDPVTADDFVYAWRRAMTPDFAADYSQLMFCVDGAEDFFNWRTEQLKSFATDPPKDAAAAWREALARFDQTVGVKATDESTLVVTLRQPTAYFLELCAFVTFMPVHRASVEKTVAVNPVTGVLSRDDSYWTDPARLVSNGPYKLARRRFKRDLLLVANDHYWNRAAMNNASILERVISDPQTAMIAYNRGEIDWLPDTPTASSIAADLVHQNRPDVHQVSMAGVYFYNFNCEPTLPSGRANPLADPRVRRALSMGIDRATIVRQVTRLNQPTVKTFVPPGAVPGYDPPTEAGVGYDAEAARALLAEAGHPGGRGLDGLSILYNTGFGHENIAQAIQRMWQTELGVVVTLEGVEVKMFSSRLKQHDYTICRASWFGDYRDPTTWLDKMAAGNGNNDCGYSNPEFDAMLERAAGQRDPVARMSLLRNAEAIMLADAPMAMIFQYDQVYLYDPERVRNLHDNAWSRWRLEFVSVESP